MGDSDPEDTDDDQVNERLDRFVNVLLRFLP